DSSGWTAASLQVLSKLASKYSFAEAVSTAQDFGLLRGISLAGLERLIEPYAKACQDEVREVLEEQQTEPLLPAQGIGRLMVVQADGVRVLGQPKSKLTRQGGKPAKVEQSLTVEAGVGGDDVRYQHSDEGKCEGIEIKAAVIYPQNSPAERSMIADINSAESFTAQVSGLFRHAGLRENDQVVAVSDGAVWLEKSCQALDIPQVIDTRFTGHLVYHACGYLETVMVEMTWPVWERTWERKQWQEGKVDARLWLERYLPAAEKRLSWSDDAKTAANYLLSRQDKMAYKTYKARGWPIGSGQIEGMNKSVIGKRMKQSGMEWSRAGAGRMAALRAQMCSRRPVASHDTLRRRAFPIPVV
ncbi:MAG: hypothetical protein M3498_16000, partial [Deinococcota bacterium]|nr:hypothetical protein [Deinococcota bacterium]